MSIDISKIYEEALNISHSAAIGAVWNAAVAETNRLRDELGGEIAGVDIPALQTQVTSCQTDLAACQADLASVQAADAQMAAYFAHYFLWIEQLMKQIVGLGAVPSAEPTDINPLPTPTPTPAP